MMRNSFNIKLIWVKNKSGIKEIEMADECAKEAALVQTQIFPSYNYAKQQISVIRKHMKIKMMPSWNKEYNYYKNDWIKKFIPTKDERAKLNLNWFEIPELVWFVTGQRPYRTHLKRMGITTTNENCPCGAKRQDLKHLLLNCIIKKKILEVRELHTRREVICIREKSKLRNDFDFALLR